MFAVEQQQPPTPDETLGRLARRVRRLSFCVSVLAVLFIISVAGAAVLIGWKLTTLKKAQDDLAFEQAVSAYNDRQDFVLPTVNTIQFLRRGYSITLDKVEYTQNGLLLAGSLGNATQLWLTSVALNFSARSYPYKFREKIIGDQFFLYSNQMEIGTAQTTVSALNPGSTASFEVTIPNVKQTSDSIEIAVWFSGERYQYLGR
jgi:hypothetical protein